MSKADTWKQTALEYGHDCEECVHNGDNEWCASCEEKKIAVKTRWEWNYEAVREWGCEG